MSSSDDALLTQNKIVLSSFAIGLQSVPVLRFNGDGAESACTPSELRCLAAETIPSIAYGMDFSVRGEAWGGAESDR